MDPYPGLRTAAPPVVPTEPSTRRGKGRCTMARSRDTRWRDLDDVLLRERSHLLPHPIYVKWGKRRGRGRQRVKAECWGKGRRPVGTGTGMLPGATKMFSSSDRADGHTTKYSKL